MTKARPELTEDGAGSVAPPTSPPPAGIRLAANVLPEHRPPARRGAYSAPDAALQNEDGSSGEPVAEVRSPASASTAERHVRRAVALAELSLLVLDQD